MKSGKMAFLTKFGQKLAIFYDITLKLLENKLWMKKWPIFDQIWSGMPFFHFSFTKKFQIWRNFSKKVKKNFVIFILNTWPPNFFQTFANSSHIWPHGRPIFTGELENIKTDLQDVKNQKNIEEREVSSHFENFWGWYRSV